MSVHLVSSPPEGAPPRELPILRTEIDNVDAQLVALLNKRSSLVIEVGKRKALDGTPVYAPHREQAVLQKVLGMAGAGPRCLLLWRRYGAK